MGGNPTPETQILLQDDFNSTVNSSLWNYNQFSLGGSFLGRTQMRQNLPAASNGSLHLQLDTFVNQTGLAFLGSEIISKQTFTPGTSGVAFEARARIVTPVAGITGGIFGYNYNATTGLHDEIDFELLGNDAVASANRVLTNTYRDEPFGAGHPDFEPVTGLTDFHIYRMEWLPSVVRWFIDGELVREGTAHVPQGPMALHLNIWAPDTTWPAAYSAGLRPTGNPAADISYTVDVDYARVTTLAPPGTIASPGTANVRDLDKGILRRFNGVSKLSQGQITDFAARIDAATLSRNDVKMQFIHDASSSTTAALVCYDWNYGQTPSANGLDYLTNFTRTLPGQGFSDLNIWVNLTASAAVAPGTTISKVYGGLSNDAFIDAAYKNIFGFAPGTEAHAVFLSSMNFYAEYVGQTPGLTAAELAAGTRGCLAGIMLHEATLNPNVSGNTYAAAVASFYDAAADGHETYAVLLRGG